MATKKRWWYIHPESDCVWSSDIKPSKMVPGPDGCIEEICEQKVFPEDKDEAYRHMISNGALDYVRSLRRVK